MAATAALAACSTAAAHGPAGWGAAHSRPAWLPQVWWAIGMCETHLDWRHRTRDYQGAFGFHRDSWDQFKPAGFPADADGATPQQQLVVARRIYDRYRFTGWGCHTRGGYLQWLHRR